MQSSAVLLGKAMRSHQRRRDNQTKRQIERDLRRMKENTSGHGPGSGSGAGSGFGLGPQGDPQAGLAQKMIARKLSRRPFFAFPQTLALIREPPKVRRRIRPSPSPAPMPAVATREGPTPTPTPEPSPADHIDLTLASDGSDEDDDDAPRKGRKRKDAVEAWDKVFTPLKRTRMAEDEDGFGGALSAGKRATVRAEREAKADQDVALKAKELKERQMRREKKMQNAVEQQVVILA